MVLVLFLVVFKMLHQCVFPDNLTRQIDLDQCALFDLLDGGVEARPHLKSLDDLSLLGIETVAAYAFEVESAHDVFEEHTVEGVQLGVFLTDTLGPRECHFVRLLVKLDLTDDVIL